MTRFSGFSRKDQPRIVPNNTKLSSNQDQVSGNPTAFSGRITSALFTYKDHSSDNTGKNRHKSFSIIQWPLQYYKNKLSYKHRKNDEIRERNDADAGESSENNIEKDIRKNVSFSRELLSTVTLAFVLMFILNTFLIRTYLIPSESMEDTLHGCTGCVNDRILIDKLSYDFTDPHPGDVVVFRAPNANWVEQDYVSPRSHNVLARGVQNILSYAGLQPPDEYTLIKRVIAVGGQKIQCRIADGGITVDGKLLHEPYLSQVAKENRNSLGPCWYGDGNNFAFNGEFGPIIVPEHNVFVMGDNRSNSKDSRFHIGDGNFGCVPVKDIKGIARWIIYPFQRAGNITRTNPQR